MNTHDKIALRGTFYILLSFFILVILFVSTSTSTVSNDPDIAIVKSVSNPPTAKLWGYEGASADDQRMVEELFEHLLSIMTNEQILDTYEMNPEGYAIMKGEKSILVVQKEGAEIKKVIKVIKNQLSEVESGDGEE